MTQPFTQSPIRNIYISQKNTYYYNANDVCQYLIQGTYTQGKNYWQNIKRKYIELGKKIEGQKSVQIKMKSADGKYRLMDVITRKQLLFLIRKSKHKNAQWIKMWLKENETNLMTMRTFFENIGREKRKEMCEEMCRTGRKVVLAVVEVVRIFDFSASWGVIHHKKQKLC